MCGIVGILGSGPVAPLLVDALKRLEYRGYDSAGVATLEDGHLTRCRAEGKLTNLEERLQRQPLSGHAGIGHTRWATHGAPTERNAHPHATERVAVVHNGIIENFKALREEISAAGRDLATDTDTEVVAHLVTMALDRGLSPKDAMAEALGRLEGASVAGGAVIGPFARLRPDASIGTNARVGNFCEIKNAEVHAGAKINHLTYIGDAEIGARANIGAGTITCNYDGFAKCRTIIGENAFIGSNSALVAPVTIGRGAYIGSGSVITDDVPDEALAIGRGRQVTKPDWVAGKRGKTEKNNTESE